MSIIVCNASTDHATVELQGRVDVRSASELRSVLFDAVTTKSNLVVDGTQCDWIDTACMQLILAAHRALDGRVTVKAGHGSAVDHWLRQSGFGAQLNLA